MKARLAAVLAVALPLGFAVQTSSAEACQGGSFAGPYLGGAIGFANSKTRITSEGDPTLRDDDTSFTVGGIAGYNIQCGQTVIGIEGDISWLGSENKGQWSSIAFGPIDLKSEVDWYATLRARAGLVVRPDMLVYLTGGIAFADLTHTLTIPNIGFEQRDGGWTTGWTFGGGLEFILRPGWHLRAEAMYVDLGHETHTYRVTAPCVGVCEDTAKWEDTFFVGRVGLTYQFGAAPEPHRPLK